MGKSNNLCTLTCQYELNSFFSVEHGHPVVDCDYIYHVTNRWRIIAQGYNLQFEGNKIETQIS